MAVNNKLVFVVMDGVGIGEPSPGNAVDNAWTPNLDMLEEKHQMIPIKAHGTEVGLPTDSDMGNSEVGHNAMGSGQIYSQGAQLVNESVESGQIFQSNVWREVIDNVKANDSTLHFIGLLSEGGVHSHMDHLKALIKEAKKEGVKVVRIHAILDGRDTPPTSAGGYIADMEEFNASLSDDNFDVDFASGGGRMAITMDRYEANWDMVELGWKTHVLAEGPVFETASEAYETLFKEVGTTDQDVPPFIIGRDGQANGPIVDGDSVVFFNFRGDRAIEISRAFDEEDFDAFDRVRYPDVVFAGMLEYDTEVHIPSKYLVNPPSIHNTLSDHLCSLGVRAYAISETQKYGHMTYFWNGNASGYVNEDVEVYDEVASDVVPFQERPWMKSAEITDSLIEAIASGDYDFLRINYPNGDMVGHTGDYAATVIGVEATDLAIGRIYQACKKYGYTLMVTADHGNAEEMYANPDAPADQLIPKTAHTTNPVPFYLYDPNKVWTFKDKPSNKDEFGLSNVAATICDVMGVEQAPADWGWNESMVEVD